ncbi:hypothetical protein B0H13DRAFT_1928735 [Mycena leptocephala]|nr:hypothetical protein B0H13DRAFT_1928735 [Mycena leptocephala]
MVGVGMVTAQVLCTSCVLLARLGRTLPASRRSRDGGNALRMVDASGRVREVAPGMAATDGVGWAGESRGARGRDGGGVYMQECQRRMLRVPLVARDGAKRQERYSACDVARSISGGASHGVLVLETLAGVAGSRDTWYKLRCSGAGTDGAEEGVGDARRMGDRGQC